MAATVLPSQPASQPAVTRPRRTPLGLVKSIFFPVAPTYLLMIIPAVVLFTFFIMYPAVQGAIWSFTNFVGYGTSKFIGLANYLRYFRTPAIAASITNSLSVALLTTVLTVGVLIWSWARAAWLSERRIAHRERLYQVLSQCNQSIVHISERDPLFARVCEIAVDLGKFRMAWIGLIDAETQTVEPATYAGAGEGFFEKVKVSLRDEPLGRGPGERFRQLRQHRGPQSEAMDSRISVEPPGKRFGIATG